MDKRIYTKESEKWFILALSTLFLILAFIVIKDILGILMVSAISSYFLFPVYEYYIKKTNNERLSALLTLFSGTFIILIPIILIFYFLILNLIKLVLQYQIYIENPDVLNEILSNFFEKFTNSTILSAVDFSEVFNNLVLYILNFTKDFTSSIPSGILYFLISIFISYYILTYNKKLLKSFNDYLPLSYKKQDEILTNITKNLKVLFKGYFLTGLLQTLVAFIGYVIFGAPNLLIVTFLTLITSLIPYLGSPLVWVPISFYLIVIGDTFSGVALLLYGTFIISMIDNFVRPYLMSDKDTMSPPMVFVGFVGGMFAFGFPGIILGPIIISINFIFLKYLVKYFKFKPENEEKDSHNTIL
jgi:predicted PurR-regulated permease PerM